MTRILKQILSYAAYLPVNQPWLFLLPLIVGTIFFAYHLPSFSLDSTTDSLIIKNDANFNFYNETRANFTSDDYIIISFEDENVLSRENISIVSDLCHAIRSDVKDIQSIESLATVPLFNSPALQFKNKMLNMIEEKYRKQQKDGIDSENAVKIPKSLIHALEKVMGKVFEEEIDNLKILLENPATLENVMQRAIHDLESEGIGEDSENFTTFKNQRIEEYYRLGRMELINHPIYSNNLISKDLTATSIVVQVPLDPNLVKAEKRKAELKESWEKAKLENSSNVDKIKDEFDSASVEFLKFHDIFSKRRSIRLDIIYEVLEKFSVKSGKTFYLGGVPVIVKKMVSNLEHDIMFFGIGIVVLLSIILFAVFFRFRWMLIPMVTCIIVAIWVIGAMAFNNDRGNIITANAITIVFVIAMAHSIHLIIKYRELQSTNPEMSKKEHLKNTLRIMAIPCFYTAMTTAAGFASFLITNIEPIITFGIYMCLGVFLALIVSFVAFPVGVMLLGPSRPPKRYEEYRKKLLLDVARITIKSRYWLIGLSVAIIGFSAYYITKLSIETKFGEYFAKDTDVYNGLYFIDNKVAGSSPLEIIFDAEPGYFKNPDNFAPLRETMQYLDGIKEIGKVDSITNLYDTIADIRQNSFALLANPDILNALKKSVDIEFESENPDDVFFSKFIDFFDAKLLNSYVSEDFSKARVLARVRETMPTLNRKELLEKITVFLKKPDFKDVKPRMTGIFLLYSNLLNSLAESQLKSFTLVFVAVFVMFLILFQSVRLALVGMLPNVMPILLVLGIMGFTGKPLDILTVMIASVTMGIAVDSTIHYIFRFKHEFKHAQGDYIRAIYRAHQTIGQSISFTSAAVIGGFFVLIFSNFVPTRFFGLFTAIAMACALFAALSILPSLIYILKPVKFRDKSKTRFIYVDDVDAESVNSD